MSSQNCESKMQFPKDAGEAEAEFRKFWKYAETVRHAIKQEEETCGKSGCVFCAQTLFLTAQKVEHADNWLLRERPLTDKNTVGGSRSGASGGSGESAKPKACKHCGKVVALTNGMLMDKNGGSVCYDNPDTAWPLHELDPDDGQEGQYANSPGT